MPSKRIKYVYPKTWKKIIAQYPNAFHPDMISRDKVDGKRIWYADDDVEIDITRWQLHWDYEGLRYLSTIDEWIDLMEFKAQVDAETAEINRLEAESNAMIEDESNAMSEAESNAAQ